MKKIATHWFARWWRYLIGLIPPSPVTVCICCYGLNYKDARSKKEMDGLEQYLRACARYIAMLWLEGKISGVILCGGYTNDHFPFISEAQTNADALKGYLKELGISIDLHLEERSYNTPQNLYWSCDYIVNLRTMALSQDVVFICDSYRHFKVWVMSRHLARYFFFKTFSFRVASFPRQDIHPNSNWFKQIGAGLLYLRFKKFKADLKVGR